MSEAYERLLDQLEGREGWVSSAELAGRLGVTTRSVRGYVSAARAAAHPLTIISASTSGYRLNRDAYAEFAAASRARTGAPTTPSDRMRHIVRRLTGAPDGLDVHALAESLFVSESTIESDLRRVRALGGQSGVTLERHGSTVSFSGTERDHRRLLSALFRTEGISGFVTPADLEREFESEQVTAFKTDLLAMLDSQGYFVNEFGVSTVLLHIAIAVDRVRHDQRLPNPASPSGTGHATASGDAVSVGLDALIETHFGVSLGDGDLDYVAKLLTTRVITPGHDQPVEDVVDRDDLAMIRRIAAQVNREYLVDLDDEAFIVRLTMHVGNLVERALDNSFSRNPLVQSIKSAYPVIYDVAVYIAAQIQREKSITMNDDEISYIALHVGAHLEREARCEERLTAAIVCPGYYDMHTLLRDRVERALGDDLTVQIVVTRTDVEWQDFATDLVLTTIPTPGARDTVVVIQPFLTGGDIDAARRAVARVRRHHRRLQIKDDLLRYFDPGLFFRNLHAADEPTMIRALGASMVDRGIIDDSYVTAAIEREAMSSTAFTDTVAVPHAMVMSATRTSIAIAVNETPMPWGDNRVNVVALIAFAESGRASFQTVFDQLVEVFAESGEVRELVRLSADFTLFIEELVRMIDR